jgi:hypothetical protein
MARSGVVCAETVPQPIHRARTYRLRSGASTEHGALDLMTKSRTFPGDFVWQWLHQRLNARKDVSRQMMAEAGHAR